jgi:flagellar hook protein FlgE
MSIFSSLYIGSSGISTMGDAIGVVGDNIANASTMGFRGSRANFQDVLGGTAANGQRFGAGVRLAGVETLFGQGSLVATGRPLDLAVRGNGFFQLKGTHDGVEGEFYTRDGQFLLDNTGTLVNQEGLSVQGFPIDAAGVVSSVPGDLNIGLQSPPSATQNLSIFANLDPASVTPAAPFDPANAAATSNFSTSSTVFDSLGAPHRVDVFFRNNGAGGWEWHALVDGGELTGGTAGTPTEIASGTLSFNSAGALDTETTTASSANFIGATPNQAIAFDFGDSITTDGGTGLEGATQFAGPSTVTALQQDGFGAGSLVDISVSEDGTLTGRYSNGQSRPVARLALATFASTEGLLRAGGQLFSETRESGAALVDKAAVGGRGAVSGGTLEGSNVNLSDELVTLIAYQRAFQTNARVVSTADEVLAELANLKR